VVPAGRHWTAMPQVPEMGHSIGNKNTACVIATSSYIEVFIPEECTDPGSPLNDNGEKRGLNSVYHEFYHILEQHFLNDEELSTIEEAYQRILNEGGCFESVYGSARQEFLTTMSEEFEVVHGPDGPRWLNNTHGEIYDLLKIATGRDPAGTGALPRSL